MTIFRWTGAKTRGTKNFPHQLKENVRQALKLFYFEKWAGIAYLSTSQKRLKPYEYFKLLPFVGETIIFTL